MVRVKPRERNKSSPRYWIFPSQKQETKEIKSQTRKRAKLGVKGRRKRGAKPEGAGSYPSRAVQSYTFTQGRPPGLNHRVGMLNCCHGARMLRRGPSYSSSNGTPCLLSYLLFKLTLGDDHFVREEISNHYVVQQELTVLHINYTSKTNTQSNKLI